MPRKPSTHRKDRNHDEIVAMADFYGWQCLSLTSLGGGAPDLLAYKPGAGFRLIEVKYGKVGKLTAAQVRFRERYTMPIAEVRTAAEAEAVFRGGQ